VPEKKFNSISIEEYSRHLSMEKTVLQLTEKIVPSYSDHSSYTFFDKNLIKLQKSAKGTLIQHQTSD